LTRDANPAGGFINLEQIEIVAGNRLVLPRSFKQFAHGYVVTAHRSQGKSGHRLR